jgi:DNA-binding transcriptional LysR family regulator
LPAFCRQHPKGTVELRVSERYVDLIEEGVDDTIRVGEPGDTRLIARRLVPHQICAFASPEYLRERGAPQHPNDLLRHDCVNFRYQSTGQEAIWPFDVGGKLVEFAPPLALIIDVSNSIAATLAAGARIGTSTAYIAAPYVRRRELVPVLHEFAYDRFHLHAVWPERRRSNPAVKAFIGFLQDICPSPAPWDVLVRDQAF